MTDESTPKTKSDKPRPTFHLVQRDEEGRVVDFETFTGEQAARRALDDDRIDAGWRYAKLEAGQTWAEATGGR